MGVRQKRRMRKSINAEVRSSIVVVGGSASHRGCREKYMHSAAYRSDPCRDVREMHWPQWGLVTGVTTLSEQTWFARAVNATGRVSCSTSKRYLIRRSSNVAARSNRQAPKPDRVVCGMRHLLGRSYPKSEVVVRRTATAGQDMDWIPPHIEDPPSTLIFCPVIELK